MKQYPIKPEFFPFSCLSTPIRNAELAGFLGEQMRAPRWLTRDPALDVYNRHLPVSDTEEIEILCIAPRGIPTDAALVYYHGGGFFFGAAPYHYRLAKEYALRTPCCVLFVQYRLSPRHPFPLPAEDAYTALQWTVENALRLGISEEKIAVGGDSAGGALAAAAAQMARDRMGFTPRFQLLVYPVTDRRMQSLSMQLYDDTPMWNSALNRLMWMGYLPDPARGNIAYASPAEAQDLRNLPPAYIETAQYDCLRDEGIAYAKALYAAGIPVSLCNTKGTMHGFDIAENARTTRIAVARRVKFMREHFAG